MKSEIETMKVELMEAALFAICEIIQESVRTQESTIANNRNLLRRISTMCEETIDATDLCCQVEL